MYRKGKSENRDLHVIRIHVTVIKHLSISMNNIDVAHCLDHSTFWGNMPNFLGSYLR